ncbi:fibrocystin-L [Biomphalaria pfeifferi]|uniref:Fibrocystin-L n=1 Tax=Biomphalaria pfeifferi TaxID=112525 RepID=A0AAD8CCW0_BIOPF|nr:fibrocystin-L [Biomphalaria pfeifferi]
MKLKSHPIWSLIIVCVFIRSGETAVPQVTGLTPKCGSINGGTRITVSGKNFARNYFNFGDGNDQLGSKVSLAGDTSSYSCELHPDGSHETQITCYTQSMPQGTYQVKVSVDGVDVPDANYCSKANNCKFSVSADCTPTILTLKPSSGLPGEFIELTGNLITDKYGANEPDETRAMILRVYFGGQKCEIRDIQNDTLYGLTFDGNNGYMKCKTEGTYIGNQDVSFLVSNEFGRSLPVSTLKQVHRNGIGMYQTFTEISELSLHEGSTEGNTLLTIKGKYFDETEAKAKVFVGDKECRVQQPITDTEITCRTPKDSSGSIQHYPGNRGFYVYIQNGTTDASSIDRSKATVVTIDQSSWSASNMGAHALQMVGYFAPLNTGYYKFCVKAASSATLYISNNTDPSNKVNIFTGSSCSSESSPVYLLADEKYYTEVYYGSNAANSYVTLVAHSMQTDLTPEKTGLAAYEVQQIVFTSSVIDEVQSVNVVTSGTASESIMDVQTIVFENNRDFVVLGLDGVFTVPLQINLLTSSNLLTELKNLPIVISLVSTDVKVSSSQTTITITSDSTQGAISTFKGKLISNNLNDTTFTAERTVLGKPKLTTFTLTMDDIPTKPIKIGATSAEVQVAVEELFSVRCHSILTTGTYVNSYEDASRGVSNVEPFCGHYAAKNPTYAYDKGLTTGLSVSTSSNKFMCLAYKGKLNYLQVYFAYKDSNFKDASTNGVFYMANKTPDKWTFWCNDVLSLFNSKASGTAVKIEYVVVVNLDSSQDVYIDQLIFNKVSLLETVKVEYIDLLRMPQVQPNGAFINTVSVKGVYPSYKITLKPHNCGYNFPLFGVASATEGVDSTYSISNGGSVVVNISSISAASPPIAGSYSVTFNGDTTPDPVQVADIVSPDPLIGAFSSMSVGFADVKASGTCSAFTFTVTMSSLPGDQPLLMVNSSGLTGINVKVEVNTLTNGGVWLNPIMGDLLQTYHQTPQVIAFINNVPTRCQEKSNCAFTWSLTKTPVVTAITPINGSEGQSVNISGSGFDDSSISNNEVLIGKTPCIVNTVNSSLIQCTLGNGATGLANIFVTVANKGLAQSSVEFTYITGISLFSPSSGSVEGGTLLTINGYGFTSDVDVTIGGQKCIVNNLTQAVITCRTPRSNNFTEDTNEEIVVTQLGSSITAGNFNYKLSETPVVQSISVSSSNVLGGKSITINGQGFGNSPMEVSLGPGKLNVSSYADNLIIATLPSLPAGSYRLLVDISNKGYADLRTYSVPDIVYTFEVLSMTPNFGSLYGGTDLVITGNGFSLNSSQMSVAVGTHQCNIMDLTETSIKCRIEDTGKYHTVSATGIHKLLGYGYAWDKDPITIHVGDYITWTWQTPQYVSDIAYSIQQTATSYDLVALPGGFSSGTKTRSGSFTHRFTTVGNFYYWTGYMDSESNIYFRGTVLVVEHTSYSAPLSVQFTKFQAKQIVSSANNTNESGCQPLVDPLSGCVDTVQPTELSDVFTFKFLKCYSPYVDAINLDHGTFSDVITFDGNGFGTEACQNEIMFANSKSNIVSSNKYSINFTISATGEPPIGELLQFVPRIVNLGYALIAIPSDKGRRFGLLPKILNISPAEGSYAGGTLLTITGEGFGNDVNSIIVELTSLSCEVKSVNYSTVICETICESTCRSGNESIQLTVSKKTGVFPASCDPSACMFSTSDDLTAIVTDIVPAEIKDESTVLTIFGSSFNTTAENLKVLIGGQDCPIKDVENSTQFTCTLGRLPVGAHKIKVYVDSNGLAFTTKIVTSKAVASISSPSDTGIYGGALMVIDGNGFTQQTSVKMDSTVCSIVNISLSQVKCILPAHAEGSIPVSIISNNVQYSPLSLSYSQTSTPKVTSIRPDSGQSNTEITITGTGFDSPVAGATPEVKIGGVACTSVRNTSATSITCTTGPQNTGVFGVQVFVEQKGFSNIDKQFTYQLSPFTISPSQGSTNGGQLVTLTGSGFLQGKTSVTICGSLCLEVNVTTSQYVCMTLPFTGTSPNCNVTAVVEGAIVTKTSAYVYDSTLDSNITSVSPARGGTGGGTLLTITGTNFGTSIGDVSVKISGVACDVTEVTDNQIKCRTGAASSGNSLVEVNRLNQGLSKQISAAFQYIDLWSSPSTWGGESPPADGDFVVIPANQIILLDTNTTVLKMLLIQGQLIFDEANVELQAENILITNNGILQVGSAEKPFPNEYKAYITLHGHLRSKELPVYGTKTLAVREGTLNLYGSPKNVVWTRLASTATANSTTLTLERDVDWSPGDEIVIATTGDKFSQKETEVRSIVSVSNNTVTLDKPLVYEHLGIVGTFGGREVHFKAEVGLLTRNVVVRGHRNVEFDTTIPACAAGFDPGEFAVQTCFQGRFGEELGSDQFGGQIMIHQMDKDTQVAQAHLQFIEVTFAGQAFRLGRYAIHFHRNGNMDKSFVRGCSIHKSFNRAVNIHGSHNALIEYNVVYDIMGGALFLEDGDEVGNIFQYNLVLFVRASTSLRNDDITPAGFWATNPNNTIRHNNVAGGTHFGSWYRMHVNPDGPGFNPNICPQATPLKEYFNNTAHSLGWFGLWIFETYVPRVGGSCRSDAAHQVAKFSGLTAWSCEKGAEAVNIGAVQFHNFTLVNNLLAGFESKLIIQTPPQYDAQNGPGIFNAVIVSHFDGLRGGSTVGGVIVPYQTGFLIKDVSFYNFDQASHGAISWTRITGTCSLFCGGFTVESEGLTFDNSPNKVKYEWESEGVVYDRDGSLTSNPGYSVAPCTPSFDSSKCVKNENMSVIVPGCVCTSDIKLMRFSFNNVVPSSLKGKDALFTTEFGTSNSPFAAKRITHPQGWAFVMMANHFYKFSFKDADKMYNISFDGVMYRFNTGDFVGLTQYAEALPDKFSLDGQTNLAMSPTMLSTADVQNGQWFYNDTERSITYAIKKQSRKKRAIFLTNREISLKTRIVRCFYRGCQAPPNPLEVLERPSSAEYWSKNGTWASITPDGSEPKELSDLTIPKNKWIIVDKPIPKLGKLILEGGLEFLEDESRNVLLDVEYLHITGRLVAGWNSSATLNGTLVIRLRGSPSSKPYPTTSGPNLGTRFIGVYGGLQLHGKDRGIIKTRLASTVDSGKTINVTDAVSWTSGDIILITTTDYNPSHTEKFTIDSISGTTITLNDTIKYRHIAYSRTVKNKTINLSAVVALLSRNIRIEGEDYDKLMADSHGARVLVAQTEYNGSQMSGFAQISNVAFYHTGQEGFMENYDPRFSIAYVDVISAPGTARYSYVKKSSFYCGFSTAIGAFGVNGLEIDNNVVYQTVHAGIRTESTGTKITNNLVTLGIWPGTYNGRLELADPKFFGSIEAILASDLVLTDNIVAGSERAGYHLKGQLCDTIDSKLWNGNVAVGTLIGVVLFPLDKALNDSCIIYNGFTLWKNFDFGFYQNNIANVIYTKNILVENGVGIFPMVVGPNQVTHKSEDKFVEVNYNIFIGKTATFSETLDVLTKTDSLINYSPNARGDGSFSACGKIGIETATFTGGSNMAPEKPFVNIMSYPTLKGITRLNGNVFIDFNACTGGTDHTVTTNKNNDDGSFPLVIQKTELINVNHSSKVLFHTPNLGKINPADCVDMDCDGLKKCLIQDLDGTFLGHVGTVLPNSAYEWNGDPRRGLGDYRIPSMMLASRTAKKIDVNSLAPHKGIFKTDNCTWFADWNAFECGNSYQWRMLTLESMDEDTETRRLSPVAIYSPEGYVDLINGPQDHGWCSGYTCQRRVSTFQAIVALDQPFDIYLTSTNPNVMRFILLSSDPNECVRLGLQLMTANRPEVRVNDVLKMPNNGYTDSNGRFRLKMQQTTGQYMPDVLNKTNAENFHSRDENMIFFVLCGNSEITVTLTEALVVSFTLPLMKEEDFFGEKIIESLAAFLNISPKKVRIVNIVRASGRRKRETTTVTMTIQVEISNEPGENSTSVNSTTNFNLTAITQQISDQIEKQGFDNVLNVTVLSMSIQEPGALNNESVPLQTPAKLVQVTNPVGDVAERMPLKVQPTFKIVDNYDNVVKSLGYMSTPWVITASIKDDSNYQSKMKHNSVQFVNGWANFTDLTILLRGSYIIEFTITSPENKKDTFYTTGTQVEILGNDYEAKANLTSSSSLTNTPLQIAVDLISKADNKHQVDLNWNFFTWSAKLALLDNSIYSGILTGNLSAAIDTSTGYAMFSDIQLSQPGKCFLQVTVQSDPPLYKLTTTIALELMSKEQKDLVIEETHTIELKFDIEYSETNASLLSAQIRNHYSKMPGIRIKSNRYKRGSIIVVLEIEATSSGYNQTLSSMCDSVVNGQVITFAGTTISLSKSIIIDGSSYTSGACSALQLLETSTTTATPGDSSSEFPAKYIIIIVVLSVLLLVIIFILVFKLYIQPKTKTHSFFNTPNDHMEYSLMSKEDTFNSFRAQSPSMPPVNTTNAQLTL